MADQINPWELPQASSQGRSGGVVTPKAPKEAPLPSPTRETERWRMMTPEEKRAAHLPEDQSYQINEAGKIETVAEGGLTEGQSKAVGFYQRMRSAETQMKRLDMGPQDWSTLIKQRISPTFSRADLTDKQKTQLDLMENWIAASLRLESGAAIAPSEFEKQARIFFPQPGAGGEEQAAKDQQRELAILGFKATAGQQGAAMADRNLQSLGFLNEAGVPLNAQGKPFNATAVEQRTMAPKVAGQAFQTDADIAAQKALQDAWDRGATAEEINQISQQMGRGPLAPEDLDWMRANRGKPRSFYAAPTGSAGAVEEQLGKVAGTGLGGYALGAANALTGGFAMPEEVKQYAGATSPTASTLGEISGGAMASYGAGRAVGALAPALSASRAALLGDIAYGGIQGAGNNPQNRALGAIAGAGGAAVGGALANRFMPGGSGTWLGGEPAAPAASRLVPNAPEALAAAEQANIPVLTSDIAPPQTFAGKAMQQVQERIPLAGTGGVRADQQSARAAAVEKLYADYGITNARDLSPELADDLIKRNADLVTKYSGQKGEVISKLSGAPVPVNNAVAEFDAQIAELARRNTVEANEAIAILKQHKDQLLKDRDLHQIEAFRKDTLSKAFDNENLPVGTRDLGEAALRKVYPKLNEDMGEFIKATGGAKDYTKWRVANKKLSDNIDDAKIGAMKTALNKGQGTPEIVENLLFSAKKSDVERLYNNLTPRGQSIGRMAILNRVMEKAKVDGVEELTPEIFRAKMRDMGDQASVFFQGPEGERLNGLLTALKLTKRAGEAGVSTNTGQQLWYGMLTGGGLGGLAAVGGSGAAIPPAAIAGGIAAMGRIYESKVSRNLLMQIAKTPAGAKQDALAAKFWTFVNQQMPAAAGGEFAASKMPKAQPEGSIQIAPAR